MKRTACQREKFVELTEKQIKDTLKGLTTDEVYGLRLSEAGELELDTDGFFTTNMMKKIHMVLCQDLVQVKTRNFSPF